MNRIFEKQGRLRATTLVTVAERRFEDARALADTGKNARANGVFYLAGFVVEILLKAKLVEAYPSIAAKRSDQLNKAEWEIWSLIWRSHDLGQMLDHLTALAASIEGKDRQAGTDHLRVLRAICSVWTIQARYSSHTTTMVEAKRFLEEVRVLKGVLS